MPDEDKDGTTTARLDVDAATLLEDGLLMIFMTQRRAR
jgi:hypothetical protein